MNSRPLPYQGSALPLSYTGNNSIGAEDEVRTRDPQLGRLMLYQLSYFRLINKKSGESKIRTYEGVRQQIYSLPQLATLVSPHTLQSFKRADRGIRTHGLLITNQLLWPTELCRLSKLGVQIYAIYLNRQNFSRNYALF